MINFCVFTFIIYAVAGSACAILFEGRRKRNRRYRQSVAHGKRLQREARRRYLTELESGKVIPFAMHEKRREAKAPRRDKYSVVTSSRTGRCA